MGVAVALFVDMITGIGPGEALPWDADQPQDRLFVVHVPIQQIYDAVDGPSPHYKVSCPDVNCLYESNLIQAKDFPEWRLLGDRNQRIPESP